LSGANHIARAKKHGVEFERFADSEILERDGYVCQAKGCGKVCDRSKSAPHPDAPTIGHIIAMSAGGAHTRENVECQCWACNALQAALTDRPVAAKIKRQRGDTGQQARHARREAKGVKLWKAARRLVSRGFDKSLSKKFSGEVVKK